MKTVFSDSGVVVGLGAALQPSVTLSAVDDTHTMDVVAGEAIVEVGYLRTVDDAGNVSFAPSEAT